MCRCTCPRSIRSDVIDYRDAKPAPSCWICGGDPDALLRAFKLGAQTAAFDTYAPNLAATQAREQREAERQTVVRWSE